MQIGTRFLWDFLSFFCCWFFFLQQCPLFEVGGVWEMLMLFLSCKMDTQWMTINGSPVVGSGIRASSSEIRTSNFYWIGYLSCGHTINWSFIPGDSNWKVVKLIVLWVPSQNLTFRWGHCWFCISCMIFQFEWEKQTNNDNNNKLLDIYMDIIYTGTLYCKLGRIRNKLTFLFCVCYGF